MPRLNTPPAQSVAKGPPEGAIYTQLELGSGDGGGGGIGSGAADEGVLYSDVIADSQL